MDISETYSRFRQEQSDADNPDRRLYEHPHVEGFDNWGPNQTHDRAHYQMEAQIEAAAAKRALDPNPRLLANRKRKALCLVR